MTRTQSQCVNGVKKLIAIQSERGAFDAVHSGHNSDQGQNKQSQDLTAGSREPESPGR